MAGIIVKIAAMRDATQLLDEPDFAQRFLNADMAPYGVELWPAASMLTEYIAVHDRGPHEALELGCGLGLVSIVAARLGWSMVASDHEPAALQFARHNAALNNVTGIEFISLDWNEPPPARRFKRILGADILYQLSNHKPIVSFLDRTLSADSIALVSDPNRGAADRFPDAVQLAGLSAEVLPAQVREPGGRLVPGRIFRVSRPPA